MAKLTASLFCRSHPFNSVYLFKDPRRRVHGIRLAMWKHGSEKSNHVGNKFSFTNRIWMAGKFLYSLEEAWEAFLKFTGNRLRVLVMLVRDLRGWKFDEIRWRKSFDATLQPKRAERLLFVFALLVFTSNHLHSATSSRDLCSLLADTRPWMWTFQPATSLILSYERSHRWKTTRNYLQLQISDCKSNYDQQRRLLTQLKLANSCFIVGQMFAKTW